MDWVGNNSQNWLWKQCRAACNGEGACTRGKLGNEGLEVGLGSAWGIGGACTQDGGDEQRGSTGSSPVGRHL